jgi:hypothetical protein
MREYERQAFFQYVNRLLLIVTKVRRENLESHIGTLTPDFADTIAEVSRPAVFEVVTVYACYNHIFEVHPLSHLRQPVRLSFVRRLWFAFCD